MAKKAQKNLIASTFLLVIMACGVRVEVGVSSTNQDRIDAMIVRHIAPNNGPGQTSPGYTELVDDHGHVFQVRQCFGMPGDIIEVKCEEKD